ncbi:MAG: aminotransferase class III-fold pyridoxal phosphate-dependent enzyme [Planctomycetota bacterium]
MDKLNRQVDNFLAIVHDLASSAETWISRPAWIELSTNNVCNLRCVMCGQSDGEPQQSMTSKQARVVLDEVLPEASLITPSSNSEPLLADLDLVIDRCRAHDTFVSLYTNATLLDGPTLRAIADRIAKIHVSFDSHRKSVFERIRVGADFDSIVKNLRAILAVSQELRIPNSVVAVLMSDNLPDLPAFVDWLADHGAVEAHTEVRAQIMQPLASGCQGRHVRDRFDERTIGELIQAACERAAERGLLFDVKDPVHARTIAPQEPFRRGIGPEVLDRIIETVRRRYPHVCSMSTYYMKIMPGGAVFPCCRAPAELEMGNVHESSALEIWNGERYRKFRRRMQSGDYPEFCKTCHVLTDNPAFEEKRDGIASEPTWSRAQDVLATGLWTPSHGALEHPGGTFPVLVRHARGALLWDQDGQEYVDWIMGWGPIMLGHGHEEVRAAVARRLADGPLHSLLHPLEVEVAERLAAMIPGAEQVGFGKNGSDVVAAAVRIARGFTRRDEVIVHGYHGFHDWYLAGQPACHGIPDRLRDTIHQLPYNDLAGLAELLESRAGHIAAIVMEPLNTELPNAGFLEGVRELTRQHQCFLIFDEIVTGFRVARGGASERYGVTPDLTCLGKALGNGIPISALCGPRQWMEGLHHVGYGLTYRGETYSLAAAEACLRIFEREDVPSHLECIGESLRRSFDSLAAEAGVGARLVGPGCRLSIAFEARPPLTALGWQTLFVQECLRGGVLTNGNFLPSFAHQDAHVARTLEVFEKALRVCARIRTPEDLERYRHVPLGPEHRLAAEADQARAQP